MVNQERLFKTFYDLLKINSPSQKEKAVADYILGRFAKLGIAASTDNAGDATGSDTGNVIAFIQGTKDGEPVLFNSHMDTIQPTTDLEIAEEEGIIKSGTNTILGADNKAGIAVLLEMIEVLKEQDIEHIPLEIAFTVCEETGLFGASALDISSLKSKMAFCFDGGGPAGYLIMQAPSQEIIEVDFKGKAVHAGIEPEKGANAIYAASKAAALFPQGRIDEETTANLGLIEGGKATNIVADKAMFKAEVRSQSPEKLEQVLAGIEKSVQDAIKETSVEADIKRHTAFTGFKLEKDEPVVEIARKAMAEIGLSPSYTISGGGSDANVFNLKGIRTLTLSMGAQMAHSKEEFVVKEDLAKTAELAVKMTEIVSNNPSLRGA